MTALLLTLLVLPYVPGSLAPAELGDSLFVAGAYPAAATEYHRDLFHQVTGDTDAVNLKLGLALGLSGEVEPATAILARLASGPGRFSLPAGLASAGLLLFSGEPDRARLELLDLLIATDDPVQSETVSRYLGWLELQGLRAADAARSFRRANLPDLADALEAIERRPRRNATTAVLLSTFVPGAGEAYAGQPLAGLLGLVVTGGAGTVSYLSARDGDWVTAAVLFGFVFLRFYSGSRRNAVDYVEEFNRRQARRLIERLPETAAVAPDWFGPALAAVGLSVPGRLLPERACQPARLPGPPEPR